MKSDIFRFFLRMLCGCCLLFTVFPLNGCSGKKEPVSGTGFYFDTAVTVTVYGAADTDLLKHCFDLAEVYENMLSRTVKGSDIWNINHAGGRPVTVNQNTSSLLSSALSYARLTDGQIDPTIGKVSALWNFTENTVGTQERLPAAPALEEALSHVDYRCVQVKDNTVTLTDPRAELDLGFIAKGFIADRMKEYLESKGVTGALINLGGNVLTLGSRTDGTPFQIGIQMPFAAEGTPAAILSAADLSVVSSGTYERYFEYNGEIYHHILDTKTGYPIRNNLSSVTILSSSSLEGDALSTACFVLGQEKGMALIESLPGTEAVFITADGTLHPSGGVTGLRLP